ncbi:uncharacterized protein LOC131438162 isoform X2 [Malaya genurostris]|nr:uncharacterized protein LOC131438162 isoform X2 [Malaya genurostris]
MYRSRMRIQEMRDLCLAVEESERDYEINKRFSDDNWPDPIQVALSVYHDNSSNYTLYERVEDYLSSSETNVGSAPSLITPPIQKIPLSQSQIELDVSNLISYSQIPNNSEQFYSPSSPQLCCRVLHTVKVEIHNEPREGLGYISETDCAAPPKKPRLLSNLKMSLEYDSIEELV